MDASSDDLLSSDSLAEYDESQQTQYHGHPRQRPEPTRLRPLLAFSASHVNPIVCRGTTIIPAAAALFASQVRHGLPVQRSPLHRPRTPSTTAPPTSLTSQRAKTTAGWRAPPSVLRGGQEEHEHTASRCIPRLQRLLACLFEQNFADNLSASLTADAPNLPCAPRLYKGVRWSLELLKGPFTFRP